MLGIIKKYYYIAYFLVLTNARIHFALDLLVNTR